MKREAGLQQADTDHRARPLLPPRALHQAGVNHRGSSHVRRSARRDDAHERVDRGRVDCDDPSFTTRYAASYGATPYGATPSDAVAVTRAEKARVATGPGQPGLWVLGFKQREGALRDDDNCRPSLFAQLDEAARPGSTAAGASLLAAMLERNVVAVGMLVRSPKAATRLVAMLLDDGRVSGTPGWHIVYLPFADDVRRRDLCASPVPSLEFTFSPNVLQHRVPPSLL